jgi:hypothetical protein
MNLWKASKESSHAMLRMYESPVETSISGITVLIYCQAVLTCALRRLETFEQDEEREVRGGDEGGAGDPNHKSR